jgi:phosphatidylinositol alpha-1,6-mannosyltransferase
MSKKIALVTLEYPPDHGGVAAYLSDFVREAQGRIDVFVDLSHGRDKSHPYVQGVHLFRHAWPLWWPSVLFMRGLWAKGYEAIFVSHVLPLGTAAWMAKRLGGLNYYVLIHGTDFHFSQTSWHKRWLLRHILRSASLVAVNSRFVEQEVKTFDQRIAPIVLTPGVSPHVYPSRVDARERLGVASDACFLLTVARLVPRKGIDQLIQSLEKLPSSICVVIVGSGSDEARLRSLAVPYGSRVRFVLSATDEERDAWYAAADVFALLAREEKDGDVEGFGIVCLEAAQASLPVVVGRSGGAPETVVDEETGFVVDPMNQEEICVAFRRLIDNPLLRERFGQAGKARAEKDFQWKDRWDAFQKQI